MSKPRRKYRKRDETKTTALLITGTLITVAIILVIVVIVRKNQALPGFEGVPLYTGTTIHRYISFVSHESFVYQLLNHTNCINSTCIVMFGLTTCPHCHAMFKFFTDDEAYRDIYKVFWVDNVGSKEFELFSNLANIEIMNNIDPNIAGAVPQTIVIRNGSIEAIVVGEVRSRDFWNKLLGLL